MDLHQLYNEWEHAEVQLLFTFSLPNEDAEDREEQQSLINQLMEDNALLQALLEDEAQDAPEIAEGVEALEPLFSQDEHLQPVKAWCQITLIVLVLLYLR